MQNTENKNNNQVVILLDKGKIVYKADYYDDESKKLHGLTVVLRDDEMKLQKYFKQHLQHGEKIHGCIMEKQFLK